MRIDLLGGNTRTMQVVYIHAVSHYFTFGVVPRLGLALLATSPWILRSRFPVNHFSDNWKITTPDSPVEISMYKIKKYQ
jgi:hypothetical protein